MKLNSTFSERLKSIREERDLTLEEMSKLLSIPKQTLHRYERDERVPKITQLTKIAEILELNPMWLKNWKQTKI